MNSETRSITIKKDLVSKIEALSKSDNRNFSNTCETILQIFFNQNPDLKTIIETAVKRQKISDFLNNYNDRLLERWTSGSKQDFTAFVNEYLINNTIELDISDKKYTEQDMKSFADWCRNALLNTEFSVSKLNNHLTDWNKLKK